MDGWKAGCPLHPPHPCPASWSSTWRFWYCCRATQAQRRRHPLRPSPLQAALARLTRQGKQQHTCHTRLSVCKFLRSVCSRTGRDAVAFARLLHRVASVGEEFPFNVRAQFVPQLHPTCQNIQHSI